MTYFAENHVIGDFSLFPIVAVGCVPTPPNLLLIVADCSSVVFIVVFPVQLLQSISIHCKYLHKF